MRTTLILTVLLATTGPSRSDDVDQAISVVRSAALDGSNATAVRQSADFLRNGDGSEVLKVLMGMDDASPLAENWLRNCFEELAAKQLASDSGLPSEQLIEFVHDTEQSPTARRVAYEWLLKEQPDLEEQLIPNMLQDPSPEFRREAVAHAIADAKDAPEPQSVQLFQKALSGAVHEDQVRTIAQALSALNESVDIQQHFGFLSEWQAIGPFDNRDRKGYAIAYPPETEVDFGAKYAGQLGMVSWQPLSTDDDFGIVDIAESIKNYKGSVMYATTTFESDRKRDVQLRLGTPNAWKMWLNGQLVFEREEYHRSTSMDQYRVDVTLNPGANRILLKICQNEQDDDWAQRYQFQIRACTPTGTAILPSGAATASSN